MTHWSQRRLCAGCSCRSRCQTICPALADELPSMAAGRITTFSELLSISRHRGKGGKKHDPRS